MKAQFHDARRGIGMKACADCVTFATIAAMDLIVIGGGPAGMMAAGRAAELGADVVLLEKNPELGRKLLITGGGRCNFTNAEPDQRVLASHYGKASKALLSPFSKFGSQDCLSFFASRGMNYKIEDLQRAFPRSDRAVSVLEVLTDYLKRGKVSIRIGSEVRGFVTDSGNIAGVRVGKGIVKAKKYILATGGTSHPETGSTGDGFNWLAEIGHAVRFPEPSLVPVSVREKWVSELKGLSFHSAGLGAWTGDERHIYRTGKLLFTHFGLSGPLVLNMATELASLRQKNARKGELMLKIDFFPDFDQQALDTDLLTRFAEQPGKKLKNATFGPLPPRLFDKVIELSKADPERTLGQISRVERLALVAVLKAFPLTFRSLMDESRAVVSSGGVALNEIDFRTMTSKIASNLAIVGDLIDINRPSGGYSLQLCWASARVAGEWAVG